MRCERAAEHPQGDERAQRFHRCDSAGHGRSRTNSVSGRPKEKDVPPTARQLTVIAVSVLSALAAPRPAAAFRAPELSAQQQKALRANFALCVGKLKGPYTENVCVCPDGRKIHVRG